MARAAAAWRRSRACTGEIEILTGTFGKAYGGQGAFVVGSQLLIDFLLNTARSQIFSTGLPPVSVHWLCFVLRQIPLMRAQRAKVDQMAEKFRGALRDCWPANPRQQQYRAGHGR